MNNQTDNQKDEQKTFDVPIDGLLSEDRCELLLSLIASGESEKVEAKNFGFPKDKAEKANLSKAIIAMENTNGGYVLLGVENDGTTKGIAEEELDPADINNVVSHFVLPEIRNIKCTVFKKDENKVGIIFVPPGDELPYITIKDSGDELRKNVIYVRHTGQSEPANYNDLQRVILKACIKKQKDLAKHLEQTEMVKDIKEIKEHLIGKETKNNFSDKIIFLESEDFIKKVENLCLDEKEKRLLQIIKILTKEIIRRWKSTKEANKQEVLEIKELYFIPLLNKLTYLMMVSIENYFTGNLFAEYLVSMKKIYELSSNEEYGYRTKPEDEWVLDNNKRRIKTKDHLTHTVPEKEVVKRLLALSAFGVKNKRFSLLKDIADLKVELKKYNEEFEMLLMIRPNFSYESGEGTLISIFDEARELVIQDKTIFSLFENEAEESLNYLLRADFLIGFILYLSKEDFVKEYFVNFARFYEFGVVPLIKKIKDNPDYLGSKFPKYSKKDLMLYLKNVINFSNKAYFAAGNYHSLKQLSFTEEDLKELQDNQNTN